MSEGLVCEAGLLPLCVIVVIVSSVSHILEYRVMLVQEFGPYGASLIRMSRTEQHSEGVSSRTPPLNVLVPLFSAPAFNAHTSDATAMKRALTDGT